MLIGIDEVGRGAWAGPLLVCGVRASDLTIAKLGDSKTINRLERQRIAVAVKQLADEIALAWVSPQVIDQIGLTDSMKWACDSIFSRLSKPNCPIVIDGNINYLQSIADSKAIIKADALFSQVSAASIVAKVARDNLMEMMSKAYWAYGFESNAGYGTRYHREALNRYGITPIHRMSYKPVLKIHEEHFRNRTQGRAMGSSTTKKGRS